eukprot:CAMPEP_0174716422 /NCGR_PEP_ID=MMETSP1094-20130205/24114_1 /TAXON_ID=156173 /ORGANISM="Chrysochromulina brevifilum, Strain UTEX LB 985" /LENGTH=73 /DNA_ID=CAMNT_0015916173 /DNA_START=221 /DNA_END=440 /DNA_ORIENTATION=+
MSMALQNGERNANVCIKRVHGGLDALTWSTSRRTTAGARRDVRWLDGRVKKLTSGTLQTPDLSSILVLRPPFP